jgi:hypothetical protein
VHHVRLPGCGGIASLLQAASGAPAPTPTPTPRRRPRRLPQVGRTKRRPTSDDLQLAFMNAAAAESPLTKTVKFFKGLTAKK